MFTEIGIENFKAFGKMQRIPLKPITLLYGPNSSGKSSLLQSLLLFKQTLEEAADDKIVLLPKGNLVDLGGYQEFIHGHDAKKDFRFVITFKYSWALMMLTNDIWDIDNWPDLSLEFCLSQEKTGEILITSIKTRDSLHAAPIMECRNAWAIPALRRAIMKKKDEFKRDGDPHELIYEWLLDLKRSVLVMDNMNLAHPLFKNYWDVLQEEQDYFKKRSGKSIGPKGKIKTGGDVRSNCERNKELLGDIKKYIEENYEKIESDLRKLNTDNTGLSDEELQEKKDELLIRKAKVRQLKNVLRLSRKIHRSLEKKSYEEFQKISKFPASDRLFSMTNCFPCDNGTEIDLRGNETLLFQNIQEFAMLGKPAYKERIYGNLHVDALPDIYTHFTVCSFLLSISSAYFKEYLRRIVYIGPLREYPERVYSYSGNIPSNVGKSGKYTPDILLKRSDIVAKINDWFYKFDIDYNLKVDLLKRDLFSLGLVDKKTGYEVSPKDVGFGIGQLLPILVQGALSENKVILVEQPEIHVHPRLQAELGSFFAEMAGRTGMRHVGVPIACEPKEEEYGNQFIIETHSEHLVLRLLRIIRDTTNGELKEGEKPLRPEDVAVIYAKPTENGTELMELRISEDGDFIDKWPDGFFTEREKELF